MNLLAPNVATVLSQYDVGMRSASEFAARGGGRNRAAAEAPGQKATTFGKMLQGVQPEAAKGLTGIGEAEMANLNTLARSYLAASTEKEKLAIESMLKDRGVDVDAFKAQIAQGQGQQWIDLEKKKVDQAKWGMLGKGVGDILSTIYMKKGGFGGIFGGGKTEAPMSPTDSP